MATKSASEKGADTANSKYIVLCLGLLIGFVAGFVLLLSSLPVENGLTDYEAYTRKTFTDEEENSYEFYQMLPNQSGRRTGRQTLSVQEPALDAAIGTTTEVVTIAEQPVLEPATRVVPANAQIVSANAYREIPANYASDQSYYLQAGKFAEHPDAQAMRAQVLLLGLEAFIVTRQEADGSTAHRVRVGPYYDQSILTEAKKRLSRDKINYEIVRVTG